MPSVQRTIDELKSVNESQLLYLSCPSGSLSSAGQFKKSTREYGKQSTHEDITARRGVQGSSPEPQHRANSMATD